MITLVLLSVLGVLWSARYRSRSLPALIVSVIVAYVCWVALSGNGSQVADLARGLLEGTGAG
jgi:hypothetical protein